MRSIDYFDKMAALHPDRPVLISGDTRISYAEMQARTHRLASAMRAGGLGHQEPVAILSPNHGAVLETLLGLWRAGAVWIPVNTRNAIDANIAYLNYVRAAWLFYHSEHRGDAERVKAEVPSIRRLICLDAADGKDPSIEALMAEGAETLPDRKSVV